MLRKEPRKTYLIKNQLTKDIPQMRNQLRKEAKVSSNIILGIYNYFHLILGKKCLKEAAQDGDGVRSEESDEEMDDGKS